MFPAVAFSGRPRLKVLCLIGMKQVSVGDPQQLSFRVTEELGEGAIALHHASLVVEHANPGRRIFEAPHYGALKFRCAPS